MLLGVLRVFILSPWVCGLSPGALVSSHTLKTCTLCWLETENCGVCTPLVAQRRCIPVVHPASKEIIFSNVTKMSRNCVVFSSLCWWFSCSDRWFSVTCSKRTHCCGAADGRGQTSWADPGSVSVGGQGHLLTGRFLILPDAETSEF